MGTGGETFAKILLIAGPSGSGKSTLIRALRQGRLGEGPLPEAARFWPETSAKEILRGDAPLPAIQGGEGLGPEGLGPEGLGPKGLIVHYDTTRILLFGYGEYANDPAIKIMEAAKGAILVVTIACPREMLFAQFLERAVIRSDGLAPAHGRLARLKRGLRQWHRRTFGPPRVSLSRMEINRLAIYGSDRELFRWNARWEACLDRLAAAHGDVHRLVAVPEPDAHGAPSFRLSAAPPFAATPLEATPLEATSRASA